MNVSETLVLFFAMECYFWDIKKNIPNDKNIFLSIFKQIKI